MKRNKLYLFLIFFPLSMCLCACTSTIGTSYDYPTISEEFFSDGSLKKAYLINPNTKEEYDLYPYSHPNSWYNYIGSNRGYTLISSINGITYEYQFDPFSGPMLRFRKDNTSATENGKDTYSLMREDNILYLCNLPRWSVFQKKNAICELLSENTFYSPIKIAGLEEYAIIVIEDIDSMSSEISVYLPPKEWLNDAWNPALFRYPDGTGAETFTGAARRSFLPIQEYRLGVSEVGQLELWKNDFSGMDSCLFDVLCSNGELLLAANARGIENWRF